MHAPAGCAVIGDTDAHLEAARRAGARGVLVASGRTRPGTTAPDLGTAVRSLLLGDDPAPRAPR
ncbi:hypothetical protein GCM10020295_16820 [Streptomyces cinereospinus]